MLNPEAASELMSSVARIETHVLNANERLQAIDKAVFTGNGTPGLLSRVTSLESSLRVLAWVIGIAIAAVSAWAAVRGGR